ncbi:MAG: 4Fe-4S dicluster domain-containing protein [bacterium]
MESFVIPKTKFDELLQSLLNEFEIYLPVTEENKQHFRKLNSKDLEVTEKKPTWALEKIRPSESLKGFFFSPRLKVASYEGVMIKNETKRLIIGAKNCDLYPMRVHQKMFLEGKFVDPFYKDQLDRTLIISADCPVPEDTCFCNLLGLTPYPTEGSAINLTVVGDSYLLEALTDKGKELIESRPGFFRSAREEEIKERDEQREKSVKLLEKINPKAWRKDLAHGVKKAKKDEFWQEHAKSCIECFGCLMICPTCFCYLLYDQAIAEKDFDRTKIWDACYYAAYARVGGGVNPRAEFLQRFKNRFHCKFMNFYLDNNFFACSGCGRCLSVCSAKIDIRKILGDL